MKWNTKCSHYIIQSAQVKEDSLTSSKNKKSSLTKLKPWAPICDSFGWWVSLSVMQPSMNFWQWKNLQFESRLGWFLSASVDRLVHEKRTERRQRMKSLLQYLWECERNIYTESPWSDNRGREYLSRVLSNRRIDSQGDLTWHSCPPCESRTP